MKDMLNVSTNKSAYSSVALSFKSSSFCWEELLLLKTKQTKKQVCFVFVVAVVVVVLSP